MEISKDVAKGSRRNEQIEFEIIIIRFFMRMFIPEANGIPIIHNRFYSLGPPIAISIPIPSILQFPYPFPIVFTFPIP